MEGLSLSGPDIFSGQSEPHLPILCPLRIRRLGLRHVDQMRRPIYSIRPMAADRRFSLG